MDRSILLVEGLEPVLDVKCGQIGQGWRHRLGDPVFGGVEQHHEVVILVHRLLKSRQVVFAGRQRVARGLDQRVERQLLGLIGAVVHRFGIGQFSR